MRYLYTIYKRIRESEDDEPPIGYFGSPFLEYTLENIDVHYYSGNDDGTYSEV